MVFLGTTPVYIVRTESNSKKTMTSIYTGNTRLVKSYQYDCSCVLITSTKELIRRPRYLCAL